MFPGENENEQIKYLTNTLGLPPAHIISRSSRADVFFSNGKLRESITSLETIDYFSKKLSERIENTQFREFIELFLKWDPKERITPQEALQHKWILEGMEGR